MRGYHIYKDIWEASVGEELPCQRESGNRADPFAVAVVKSGVTVGHIPRKISSVCSFFLHKGGVINICTTARRRFSADLPHGGLENPGKEVQKVKKLVTVALLTTPAIENSTDESQANKRRRIGEGSVEMSEDISEWVQCVGVILTDYDRKILATGEKLTDQHMNFAQTLLRLQFPELNGLQSTLYQSRSTALKANRNALQIIHSRGDHWIVATTIECDLGEVRVFNSVYESQDDETHQTIRRMFGSNTSLLQVSTVNALKQQGGNDCGMFAIAISTCLAFGGDPTKMVICQARMRDHLLKCFEDKLLTQF